MSPRQVAIKGSCAVFFSEFVGAIGLSSRSRILAIFSSRLRLGFFLKGDPPFGLYRVMLGGGVASLKFSSVRTGIVMSMRTFPSVCFSILSGVWFFDPHEIMSTLFFGAGGGELGDSGSVSLLLLFEGPLAFPLDFGVTGSSSSSSVSPLVFLFSL
ncbi:hypothetical protein F2Q69_00027564 [Brassica cretica]|uniref:Uncharacterized protein n=1 Tax=Brassica cretica TaxID=69181 RepID=A0A8S9RX40_BRACR|nr:hypothetical protein F2Q69_00027564 [Brassica cretica]